VAVGASQAVPQREVLAVVVVEEQVVVGVVGSAVDHLHQRAGHPVVPVVDGDGPDVDEDVKGQVEDLVQGEEEGVDVVGQPLEEAVHWVEGVAGEGRGHLPHVVRLVEQLSGDNLQLLVEVSCHSLFGFATRGLCSVYFIFCSVKLMHLCLLTHLFHLCSVYLSYQCLFVYSLHCVYATGFS